MTTEQQAPAYEVFEGPSKYEPAPGQERATGWGIRRLSDGVVIRQPRTPGERGAVEEQCARLNARTGA